MSRAALVLALLGIFYVCVNNVNAQCPGPNEIFRSCGSMCEPTCKDPNPYCIEECLDDRCQCAPGYVRNSNNVCIPLNEC